MNLFYDQIFNHDYVNPAYYQAVQSQAVWQYQQNQTAEVQKAVKATHDLCEAVNKLDAEHFMERLFAAI